MTTQTVRRYTTAYNEIREQAGDQAAALWLAIGGLSQPEIDRYVERMVPAVRGAQVATARLVAGYLSQLSMEHTRSRFPYSVDPDEVTDLRGVAPTVVYARPGVDARTARGQGMGLQEAMGLGQLRARTLAASDVALAQRSATVSAIGADARIVGYRRVLTGQSCAYCAAASTQRYRTDQLAPLHHACDCGVAPVYGTDDPGQVVNEELLADIKETGGPEYWKDKGWGVDETGTIRARRDVPVLGDDGSPLRTPSGGVRTRMELGDPVKPAVRTHGELGPTLVDPKYQFTGPADIAA